jgi:hypothetical protein
LLFLGWIQLTRGKAEQAADYVHQALEVYKRMVGPDYYRTLRGKLSLAITHLKLHEPEPAKALCEEVLSSPQIHPDKGLKWTTLHVYSLVLTRSGMPNAAIFYGKQAVNIIQGLRSGISSMEQALQKGFVLEREFAYRHLAALLIEEGRLPEAQQVLTMLKEEEHFDYLRRDIGRRDVRETVAEYTPTEQTWLRRYQEIKDRLVLIGLEYEELMRKKKLGMSEADQSRLGQLREDLTVGSQAFSPVFDQSSRKSWRT